MAKCKLTTETHHMVTFSIKFLSCQGEGGGWLKGREGGTLQQYKEKRRENEDGNLNLILIPCTREKVVCLLLLLLCIGSSIITGRGIQVSSLEHYGV